MEDSQNEKSVQFKNPVPCNTSTCKFLTRDARFAWYDTFRREEETSNLLRVEVDRLKYENGELEVKNDQLTMRYADVARCSSVTNHESKKLKTQNSELMLRMVAEMENAAYKNRKLYELLGEHKALEKRFAEKEAEVRVLTAAFMLEKEKKEELEGWLDVCDCTCESKKMKKNCENS